MTQKINLRTENEDGRIPDTACQDHMIGKILLLLPFVQKSLLIVHQTDQNSVQITSRVRYSLLLLIPQCQNIIFVCFKPLSFILASVYRFVKSLTKSCH